MDLAPSSTAWIAAAVADLATPAPRLLLDHAHCEKKAAAMALRHVERHAGWPRLALRMSRLAREELVHFERVLDELRLRGISFRAQPGGGYGAALLTAVRAPSPTREGSPGSWLGERTIDEMLVCAIIEARSHERFVRLAEAMTGDDRLGRLYADLRDAEARHGEIYLELAEEVAGGSVTQRLAELVAYEATVIARAGQPLRIHSGG